MNLNLNWFKSYDKKHKNAKNAKDENFYFCIKSQKKRNGNICVLRHKGVSSKPSGKLILGPDFCFSS